jgi:hypothetical protein
MFLPAPPEIFLSFLYLPYILKVIYPLHQFPSLKACAMPYISALPQQQMHVITCSRLQPCSSFHSLCLSNILIGFSLTS